MEGSDSGSPADPSEVSQRDSVSSAGARARCVLIYLVNDTAVQLTVESLSSITALDLGRMVREALQLPETSADVFALWLVSPLLELQLKSRHQPYKVCRQWQDLLYRFTECREEEITHDEPFVQFRRNVFFPKAKELLIEEEGVLRLLYEEAKCNILEGRYPCDPQDCESLGALSCRVELGRCEGEEQCATVSSKLGSFLPPHLCGRGAAGLLSVLRGGRGGRGGERLLQAYRSLPEHSGCSEEEQIKRHLQSYLSLCHHLPYYGCAMFSGQIDKPAQGLLQRGGRKSVSVGISLEGVYIIDTKEKHVLLGLGFSELSWEHSYPEEGGDSHILWLEFDGEEAGTPVNKLLKIYSKQAELMSGLIEFCVELGAPQGDEAGDVAATQEPPGRGRGLEKRGKLRRQNSVVCNRIENLSTINYVEEGEKIKRVKPKRAASFFSRQPPSGSASYTSVQVTDSLEQG
ncbi:FERM domain-containing protein 8-like [Huso huso]|uniref:FERM domain-containing protein 8 n=1 Tax=Huso huso TaxID=61971 RepID=A0ABR0YYL3_HUSHU